MKHLPIGILIVLIIGLSLLIASTSNAGEPVTYTSGDLTTHTMRGLSLDRPSTVTLSEMEKANNALARVFGRVEPHVAQPIVIIQWDDGVLVK